MRYAARADGCQTAIVKALRKAGWAVEIIGRPVDLLLAKHGFTMVMECKKAGKETRKDQAKQQKFMQDWPGVKAYGNDPIDAVTKAEALRALRALAERLK